MNAVSTMAHRLKWIHLRGQNDCDKLLGFLCFAVFLMATRLVVAIFHFLLSD